MTDRILDFFNFDGATIDTALFDQFWLELVALAARGREWLDAADLGGVAHDYLGPDAEKTSLVFASGILLVLMIVSLMVMLALIQDREPAMRPGKGAAVSYLRGIFSGPGSAPIPAEPTIEDPAGPSDGEDADDVDDNDDADADADDDEGAISVPSLTAKDEPDTDADDDDDGKDESTGALANIEAEMMTLKELHARGHISSDEYIAESRALYDRARLFR